MRRCDKHYVFGISVEFTIICAISRDNNTNSMYETRRWSLKLDSRLLFTAENVNVNYKDYRCTLSPINYCNGA